MYENENMFFCTVVRRNGIQRKTFFLRKADRNDLPKHWADNEVQIQTPEKQKRILSTGYKPDTDNFETKTSTSKPASYGVISTGGFFFVHFETYPTARVRSSIFNRRPTRTNSQRHDNILYLGTRPSTTYIFFPTFGLSGPRHTTAVGITRRFRTRALDGCTDDIVCIVRTDDTVVITIIVITTDSCYSRTVVL